MIDLLAKKEAFVYCWTDWDTNKLYLGSHKGSSDDGYICSSKYMLEEYNKRPDRFTRQIVASGLASDMRNFEAVLLKKLNAANDPRFYNKVNSYPKLNFNHVGEANPMFGKRGSQSPLFGRKHSLETKQKMSASQKGEKNGMYGKSLSEEHKRILKESRKGKGTWNKGLKHSIEAKQRMSEAQKGRYHQPCSEQTKEKLRLVMRGKKHSDVAKNKVSLANKGKKLSDETKKKMSIAKLGKPCSEQTKEKLRQYYKLTGKKPGSKNV